MDPVLRLRVGDDPADLPPSETSGTLLPLCALAESSVAGGVAAFSELKVLRKSRYFSLLLALTGISSQSLSNWQRSRGHLPRVQTRVGASSWAGSAAKEKTWKKETHPSCRPQLGGSLQKAGRAEAESYPWLPQGIFKLIWALSERFKAIKSCDQAQRLSCGTEGCFRSKCKPGEPSQAPCCCLQAPEPCEQRTMCHGPRPPCLRPQFISPSGQTLSSHDMKREASGELVGLHGFVLVSSDATDSQSRTLRSLLEPLWMT